LVPGQAKLALQKGVQHPQMGVKTEEYGKTKEIELEKQSDGDNLEDNEVEPIVTLKTWVVVIV